MMKKIFVIAAVFVMLWAFSAPAFAASAFYIAEGGEKAEDIAERLSVGRELLYLINDVSPGDILTA